LFPFSFSFFIFIGGAEMRSIPAIPTTYNGINMRSRLEARWAHLFDQFGWQWHYEPLEFDGWIPDFVIDGHNSTPLVIDVKPYRAFPEGDSLDVKIRRALRNDFDKYNLFVTRAYPTDCIGGNTCLVGWISECWADEEGEHFCWNDAVITHPYSYRNDFGLSAFSFSY
jgi:hypothetical protein